MNQITTISQYFCDEYYSKLQTVGMAGVMYMFDQNAQCCYGSSESNGIYNIFTRNAISGIHRTIVDNLNWTSMAIGNRTLLIQAIGLSCDITYWGSMCYILPFVDTFVLQNNNGNWTVMQYIHKILQ